jgi:hypothetical protein
MNISSYIFQSPYPSPIQVGRPDPQAEKQEVESKPVETLTQTTNKVQPSAEAYVAQATGSGSSVNVAASSTDSGVSSSLGEFTSLNNKSQAAEAYTS